MRIAMLLVLAAILSLVLGAITVLADGKDSPDAPSRLTSEEQVALDHVIEKTAEIESVEEPGNEINQETEAELRKLMAEPVTVTFTVSVTLETVWEKSPDDMSLEDRLVKAVLRSRTLPRAKGEKAQFYWERCGVPTPEDQLIPQAAEWVAVFLYSLEEVRKQTGVQIPLWGAFATMANEGGFNECSLNYEARKWASEHEGKVLITETWHGRTVKRKVLKKIVDKFQQSYDRDTVWHIVTHPDYKDAKVEVKDRRTGELKKKSLSNKFDGGVWQMRHSMKTMTREKFDELTSMVPGVYLGAREMARRSISYMPRFRAKDPHPRPWMLWPGWNPFSDTSLKYDDKITMIARWLGARKNEIERGYLPVPENRMANSRRAGHLVKSQEYLPAVDSPMDNSKRASHLVGSQE